MRKYICWVPMCLLRMRPNVVGNITRIRTKPGYVDLAYKLKLDGGGDPAFSAGGMYGDKKRDSFFNEYTFNSATGSKNPQYINKDWFNFDEIQFVPRPYGNIGDPLNYDAMEKIGADMEW